MSGVEETRSVAADRFVSFVRASRVFGEGSGSVIDECWSDEMLADLFRAAIDRVGGPFAAHQLALRHVGMTHEVWEEGMADAEIVRGVR